jgi:hypothetical protein
MQLAALFFGRTRAVFGLTLRDDFRVGRAVVR